ncbi:MerR family DNA-binding transcriptional regulator [Saccharopolyspora rhizosphaerae]|uniref:MerR family DNA-binding transcriptional regulator n=1 Tax=Saccharopolyspora rhizosphaerae TaxID=2492662 RepID=UPI0013156B7D
MDPLQHAPLTIGQVAELADVSPRTLRHYHQIGLLGEAERDSAERRATGPGDRAAAVDPQARRPGLAPDADPGPPRRHR